MLTQFIRLILFSSFSQKPLLRCRTPTPLSATSKVDRGKSSRKIPHTVCASPKLRSGNPHAFFLRPCMEKPDVFFGTRRRRSRCLLARSLLRNTSRREKHHKRSIDRSNVEKESKRQLSLLRSYSRKKGNDEVLDRAPVPRRSVHLERLAGNLTVLTAEETSCSKIIRSLRVGQNWQMGSGKSDRLQQNRTFSTLFCVWEEARCGKLQEPLMAGGWKIAKEADHTLQKTSTQNSSIANSTSTGFTTA